MKKITLAVAALLILAGSSYGFDGMRKGFVLGGGLGFGPVARVAVDGVSGADDSRSGLATNFLIGYAWDEFNMIVFLRDAVFLSDNSISQAQGFVGVGFYHYFGPVGNSAYLVGGLGLQDWTSLEDNFDSNDPGAGMLLGGGYEFARHIQFHTAVSFGKTSDSFFDYNHVQLTVGVSAVAF